MRELCDDLVEVLRRSVNHHEFELGDSVRDDLKATVRERATVPLQPRVDRGGF